MSTTGRDMLVQQIADAIEAHADGLSMDDENDRRAMAKWIAEKLRSQDAMAQTDR